MVLPKARKAHYTYANDLARPEDTLIADRGQSQSRGIDAYTQPLPDLRCPGRGDVLRADEVD